MDDIVEAEDVLVVEFFHQGNFADSRRGCAFFCVEGDFFECDELLSFGVAAFEDLQVSVLLGEEGVGIHDGGLGTVA